MQKERMKFIYITPFADEDFFAEVKRGMRDAARLMDVDCEFAGTHDADYPALIAQIDKAIAQRYDGIALSLAHPTAFREAAERVKAAGIPLVGFNIDSGETWRMACVCQRFVPAGRTFGRLAEKHLKEDTTVLITMHDAGVSALEERIAGMMDVIGQKRIHFKTIVSGNTPELARDSIRQHLSPDVSAVLCTGQSDTHGAGLAALEADHPVYVAGFDVCDEIRELIAGGVIDFTIDQQPYVQGFYPLLMMVQYLREGVTPFDIDAGNGVIRGSGSAG